jgi:hypothetical protein
MATADSIPAAPNLEPRVAVLEEIAADMRRGFDRIDKRFDSLERRLESLDKRQHTDFLWLVSLQIGSVAALLGVMAHGFRWI